MRRLTSDDVEVIFGSEAAEAERDERLREYFYKNPIFDELTSQTRFKIVTGFKGTGKSAVMRMAYLDDLSRDFLAIWLTPDDLGAKVYPDARGRESDRMQDRMMKAIRIWKTALWQLIARRVSQDSASMDQVIDWLKKADVQATTLSGLLRVANPAREHAMVAVYIDDLDRAWAGAAGDKAAVAGLIYAMRDLTRDNKQLRVRISLRNDVYWDVRVADQGLDKVEANVVDVKWTLHEILVMLVKRVVTWMGQNVDERQMLRESQESLARRLQPVFEARHDAMGPWGGQETHKILLSLVRRRPRDMVKLCTFAARETIRDGRHRISARDILKILPEYSRGRIDDLITEFKQVLPQISHLILGMRPTQQEIRRGEDYWYYRTDRLLKKVQNIVERVGKMDPLDAAHWLYKVGFITARKDHESGLIERKYFDDDPHLLTPAVGDAGYAWEIHPAYREYLNPGRVRDWMDAKSIEAWASYETRLGK